MYPPGKPDIPTQVGLAIMLERDTMYHPNKKQATSSFDTGKIPSDYQPNCQLTGVEYTPNGMPKPSRDLVDLIRSMKDLPEVPSRLPVVPIQYEPRATERMADVLVRNSPRAHPALKAAAEMTAGSTLPDQLSLISNHDRQQESPNEYQLG